jgi:hypothetical protein
LSYGDSTHEIAYGFCIEIEMLRDDDDNGMKEESEERVLWFCLCREKKMEGEENEFFSGSIPIVSFSQFLECPSLSFFCNLFTFLQFVPITTFNYYSSIN